ncbi:MAG: Gfo/Idh/MocA family oxidoreductase [Opitutaceae bacterium]|nr:Gfo/Idh/MocA family oxidoreductase [Opitutaceae bacterium]
MSPFPSQTRRQFLSASASAASLAVLSPFVSANSTQANSRLRLAQIGVGGRGKAALTALQNEQYVAFCDVDEQRGRTETMRGEQTRPILEKFGDARWFKDYRQLFDRMADQIDGVVVSTPDHSHFPAAMAAIAAGKHVYVEKPLCRCVQEVRRLQAAARAAGVVTQMGNQGRAAEGIRLAREWIAAGLIGEVHTVHAWTDRPRMPWFHPARFDPDVPETVETPPPTLDWDLWLGPSPLRPYRSSIAPSLWRSFVDYGCGSLGDMGCHQLDAAVYALDLAAPESIEAASSEVFPKTFPDSSTIGWKFAGTAHRAPVEVRWFDGALRPPQPVPGFKHNEGGGSLFYGTKGMLSVGSHSATARLLPESRMQELAGQLPAKSIARVQGGPFVEWARAIRGGPACGSNFDYAANLTELVLLGVVALRARGFLQWDSAGMRFPNRPDADRFLLPGYEYRPGWSI